MEGCLKFRSYKSKLYVIANVKEQMSKEEMAIEDEMAMEKVLKRSNSHDENGYRSDVVCLAIPCIFSG